MGSSDDYVFPRFERLDFSMWHPLDHRPFDRRCRSFYSGGRRHLWLLWHFRWEIPRRIRRVTRCPFGRHEWVPWWRGNPGRYMGRECCNCYLPMPEALPSSDSEEP
jgi:hypothetical protein